MATTINDLLKRKFDRLFEITDVDRTGSVGQDDYVKTARRFATAAGAAEDSSQIGELTTTYQEIWREFQAAQDTDGDGRITRDQFVASLESALTTDSDKILRFAGVLAKLYFTMADTDGDGFLSKAEHARLGQEVFGVTAEEAETSFGKLDALGLGQLALPVYLVATTEFIASPDPNASGNWLFGRF